MTNVKTPSAPAKKSHQTVQSILNSHTYIKNVYFDASAIVKLLIKDGSIASIDDARTMFNGYGVVSRTTMICFAEALGVLKRKRFFPGGGVALTALQYSGAIFEAYCMIGKGGLLQLDPMEIEFATLDNSDTISTKYEIDHSDALQIASIKEWPIDTYLCTADQGLADAADAEGIKVAFLK